MPKKTLLEMVQFVAKKIGSDEVSALGDSVETDDIQEIVLETLEDLVTRTDWEFLKDNLDNLEDGSTTISMNIPTTVEKIQTVRYKTANGDTKTLHYLKPDDYLFRMQQTKSGTENTEDITVNGVTLVARTNKDPQYWTILDEIIFVDSYDNTFDATGVVGSNSVILVTNYFDFTGSTSPTWIAPMPEKMFSLWKSEAVAEASAALAGETDDRAERKARRQYVQQQRREPVFKRDQGGSVNYGR